MAMTQYLDAGSNRLVYLGCRPSEAYWASCWSAEDYDKALTQSAGAEWVVRQTRSLLDADSRILEGGCGRGDKVYCLQQAGYRATGIDFSHELVDRIRQLKPELDIRFGDVRALPFEDESFDGYWSLGVIEHFRSGYLDILAEARRVLRPGGILFLAAPSMSPIRRLKATLRLYPRLSAPPGDDEFYQFALDPKAVLNDCREVGFSLVEQHPYDPMTTLVQESGPLSGLFRWV